ncbi:hypothetical protein BT69DRAFT_1328364 [Atractiella rhizophila]|nr:hypothetical protein BT69DRAFT_1328364 [Atractiella rhizophila]
MPFRKPNRSANTSLVERIEQRLGEHIASNTWVAVAPTPSTTTPPIPPSPAPPSAAALPTLRPPVHMMRTPQNPPPPYNVVEESNNRSNRHPQSSGRLSTEPESTDSSSIVVSAEGVYVLPGLFHAQVGWTGI